MWEPLLSCRSGEGMRKDLKSNTIRNARTLNLRLFL